VGDASACDQGQVAHPQWCDPSITVVVAPPLPVRGLFAYCVMLHLSGHVPRKLACLMCTLPAINIMVMLWGWADVAVFPANPG
jgi:hypothetical protein